MPFRFLRDPIFLGAVTLFLLNIFVFKPHLPRNQFTHSYLTDLLCLPVWVPFMLWLMRIVKLRDDSPPRPLEILVPWVFWSLMFEVILPRTTLLGRFAPGDPLDVAAYGVGGIFGFLAWRAWYGAPRTLKLRA
jgi:hypothetical protein